MFEPILKGTEYYAWLVPVPAMADEQILRAQNATYALLDSQAPVPNCCVHWKPGYALLNFVDASDTP